MRVSRGLLFWGIALITAGVVALAVQQGLVQQSLVTEWWRLWPLILVALGLSILASRTVLAPLAAAVGGAILGGIVGAMIAAGGAWFPGGCGGGTPTVSEHAEGSLADQASVQLDFNCGRLDVDTADGDAWSLDYGSTGTLSTVDSSADRLAVRSPEGVGFEPRRQAWELTLPTGPSLDLTASLNAASGRIDLSDASLAALGVEANAGDLDIDLSGVETSQASFGFNAVNIEMVAGAGTELIGELEVNAGNLDFCVAEGLEIELTVDGVFVNHDFADAGLERDDDTWRSPGAGDGFLRLALDGNASNFSLSVEETCE